MTRLEAGVIGELRLGPLPLGDLCHRLEEPLYVLRTNLSRLEARGVVSWTVDGWTLVETHPLAEISETNAILAETGEPRTCLEEVERWREWQAERRVA